MSQTTSIEWTDLSWNPTFGCSKVSPGCAHCYAETLALRFGLSPKPWTPANEVENVILKPHKLREPLGDTKDWRGLGGAAASAGKADGKLVFVNSTSDLFHEQVPNEFIAAVFGVMAAAEHHTFQILTKRPDRMRDWFAWFEAEACNRELWITDSSSGLEHMPADLGFQEARAFGVELGEARGIAWPLPNVWLGVSIENRRFVGRADVLRETPAAVRFISAEPLLGPLLADPMGRWYDASSDRTGWAPQERVGFRPELDLREIDWVIVGGESGARHRPVDAEWVRAIRDRCMLGDPFTGHRAGATAFFFKQWGGRTPKAGGRELGGREWSEFPTSEALS